MRPNGDQTLAGHDVRMKLAEDLMRTVTVRAQSPDNTVTVVMTAEAGISVRFAPGSVGCHTTRSLNTSVGAALTGAAEGFHKAGEQVSRREWTDTERDAAWNCEAGRRLRPMIDALDEVAVTGVSPREIVKVGLKAGKIAVAFTEQALGLHEDLLAQEIEAAIRKAYDRRSSEAERLYAELVSSRGHA